MCESFILNCACVLKMRLASPLVILYSRITLFMSRTYFKCRLWDSSTGNERVSAARECGRGDVVVVVVVTFVPQVNVVETM